MNPLVTEIGAALTRQGALPDGSGCVVAVSGGRDSMVLVHVLAALRPERRWRLVVAHFHHQLREAADEDAKFVAAAAGRLALEFAGGTEDVRGARGGGESMEAVARRLRHAFLARTARERGCEWVATGHHADDQAELFLMRLLRGAGGWGLGGMRFSDRSPSDPVVGLVRPLLTLSGPDLDGLARDLEVGFREDASNRDPSFLRNRVRHELIPLLESRFQPALGRVLAREQVLLREQAGMMAELAGTWVDGRDARPFHGLPRALQREVLRLQLERLGVAPGFELIEALRGEGVTTIEVKPGFHVVGDAGGRLRLLTRPRAAPAFCFEEREVELRGGGGKAEFASGVLEWSVRRRSGGGAPWAGGVGEERFDADLVGGVIRLRHWRPGDRFQPIGLPRTAKLQDLFTNARVPAAERRRRVLGESSAGVLFWVEGLRVGEAAKLTADTRQVLTWRWRREGEPPPRNGPSSRRHGPT